MLRHLIQAWLANTAKAKVREAVVRAAHDQVKQAVASSADGAAADAGAAMVAAEPQRCHVGVVFALGIESGCFEDRLNGCVTIRGERFVAREGGLKGRRVLAMLSGAGRKNACEATEVLIDGHHPLRIISAGFAGGLHPTLKRNDILLVDRVVLADGSELPVELSAELTALAGQAGVHVGSLLSVDQVVRLPRQKQQLGERYGALAVDMETFAVAEVCRRREVPFVAIRVINDTASETLSCEAEHLLVQKSNAARFGAAVGALLRRPGSAKDMYQMRENALVASARLAKFLAGIVGP